MWSTFYSLDHSNPSFPDLGRLFLRPKSRLFLFPFSFFSHSIHPWVVRTMSRLFLQLFLQLFLRPCASALRGKGNRHNSNLQSNQTKFKSKYQIKKSNQIKSGFCPHQNSTDSEFKIFGKIKPPKIKLVWRKSNWKGDKIRQGESGSYCIGILSHPPT